MKWIQVSIVLVLIMSIVLSDSETNTIKLQTSKRSQAKSRDKRSLWFPYNTAIALAVVLAIPLHLKNRNVYMSYNFETNFYLPYFDKGQGIVPVPFATIDEPDVNSGTIIFYQNHHGDDERALDAKSAEQLDSNSTSTSFGIPKNLNSSNFATESVESIENSRQSNVTERVPVPVEKVSFKKTDSTKSNSNGHEKRKKKKNRVNREILTTLLSRKKFYKILEHKLDMTGLNGRECVLRAICETSENPFEEHNGVLGDIFHIIFTPTTSRNEKLPMSFYEAIENGKSALCHQYHKLCPIGIFDLITETIKTF